MAEAELRYTYRAKGTYWRFRHKQTGDVALPHVRGLHWSLQPQQAAFIQRYGELLGQVERAKKAKPVSRDSFAWLIREYEKSGEFKSLANDTREDYSRTLKLLRAALGEVRFAYASRATLKAVRDDHAETTRKAHKIKQMLSRLYSWADEQEYVPEGFNPAAGIKRLKRQGGAREYVVWSDAEISLFLGQAPAYIITPVLIALYTGQRRADVVRMTWQQYQGDIVRVRQSKTTALLDIACHGVLRQFLERLRASRPDAVSSDPMCLNSEGAAFASANALSMALRREVTKIDGLPNNRSLHGLRYAAGSRMEEGGCTVAEIESVLGHNTFKMALKYASQRLRAKAALAKLEGSDETMAEAILLSLPGPAGSSHLVVQPLES